MRALGIFLGGVVVTTPLLCAAEARAADDEMATAVSEFDVAANELSLSAPCDTMCRALQSMVRAANRICELARDSSALDQKKCADAKQKVADATAKVRAACPNCDPSPPYAPSTSPPVIDKGSTKMPEGKPADLTGKSDAPAPPAADSPRESYAMAGGIAARRTTVALDVLPLFAPPFVVQARVERAVTPWLAISIIGGYGSLPKNGPDAKGRVSALALGGELRGYVFGGFDRFGVFIAADVMHRSSGLGEAVAARSFPLGLTVGGLVGTKLVTRSGFTLEARIGAAYLASDRRFDGGGPRLLPHGGVSAGWTF